jgi:membrane protease YdiL (CAAX protease family)
MPADSRVFDDSVWTLINVVIVAPIFEEIIFRGKLYNILRVSSSPIVAVLLSSTIFGIIHFEPVVFISGILSGLLFSYAYIRTRSIYSPILLHMCNNALAYALTILSYSERSLLDLVESDAYNFIIYYVSSIILVVSMIAMVIRIARSR